MIVAWRHNTIKLVHAKYEHANTTRMSYFNVGVFSFNGELQMVVFSAALLANRNQAGDQVSKQHSMDEDDRVSERFAESYGMFALIWKCCSSNATTHDTFDVVNHEHQICHSII